MAAKINQLLLSKNLIMKNRCRLILVIEGMKEAKLQK